MTVTQNLSMNRTRIDRILTQFSKRKILVFGDVGVDKYTIGRVWRISPEAPIPVVEVTNTELKLGLAANVADNITALGGEPLLVGVIGKDMGGHEFTSLLKKNKISDRHLVVDPNRKTTLKERVVAESQQVVRIDHETQRKINAKVIRDVWSKLEKALREADGVIIEDYAKGLVEVSICRQLMQAAEERGLPVLVDPNMQSTSTIYQGCTVITPNTNEAEAISGVRITDMSSLRVAGNRILDEVGARIVIITRGKDGMAIFVKGGTEPILIPTFAREVFDVSGAGDTVIATLSLALVSGADIVEASLLANFAAGIEVGKRGTATVSLAELREYIKLVESKSGRVRLKNA
ncbi:MAG: D-glycero-beta-D-manno-heptose-7-phosphate kinase [Bdellovibrionota bacterium]